MNKILTIARRDFTETIRTKTFIVGVLLMPLLVIGLIALGGRITQRLESGPRPPQRVALINADDRIGPALAAAVSDYNQSHPGRLLELRVQQGEPQTAMAAAIELVRQRELDALLEISPGLLDGTLPARLHVYTDGLGGMQLRAQLQQVLNHAAMAVRLEQLGIAPELAAQLRRGAHLELIDLRGGEDQPRIAPELRMMVPFFFILLILLGLLGVNQHMLFSIIEEKSSRVIEVILSAASPLQFMAGKILGLTAVGLIAVGIWGGIAIGAAYYHGLASLLDLTNLGWFLLFYLLGFLLYSSIYAAIGSACNTIKETQNLVMPVTMMLVIPMIGWPHFSQYPNGLAATALSFFPPVTPLMMTLRLASRPDLSLVQVAGAALLLAVSVLVVIRLAAKIFRIGILMHGKPATARELLRWMKHR